MIISLKRRKHMLARLKIDTIVRLGGRLPLVIIRFLRLGFRLINRPSE